MPGVNTVSKPNYIGGSKGRSATPIVYAGPRLGWGPFLIKPYAHNIFIKSNDWYHVPNNTASWSRCQNRGLRNKINRRV